VAVPLFVTIQAKPSDRFRVVSVGEGSGEEIDESHIVYQAVLATLGHDRVEIRIDSQVPLARGLGSSGALLVSLAAALGHHDPLRMAMEFEGHAENVAASFYGGFVATALVGGQVRVKRLPMDPALRLVVVIPTETLSTSKARSVLPKEVKFFDAVRNVGAATFLASSLANLNDLERWMFEDRLHQYYREGLYPKARQIIEVLNESGCIGAAWSGAGTSCVGLTSASASREVLRNVTARLSDLDPYLRVMVFPPELKGLVTLEL
jgi:homoserine kinase